MCIRMIYQASEESRYRKVKSSTDDTFQTHNNYVSIFSLFCFIVVVEFDHV